MFPTRPQLTVIPTASSASRAQSLPDGAASRMFRPVIGQQLDITDSDDLAVAVVLDAVIVAVDVDLVGLLDDRIGRRDWDRNDGSVEDFDERLERDLRSPAVLDAVAFVRLASEVDVLGRRMSG